MFYTRHLTFPPDPICFSVVACGWFFPQPTYRHGSRDANEVAGLLVHLAGEADKLEAVVVVLSQVTGKGASMNARIDIECVIRCAPVLSRGSCAAPWV